MSSMMPYTIVKPSASRAYIMPSDSPLTSCCRTTASCAVIFALGAKGALATRTPRTRLALRRYAEELVQTVLHLEDGHDLVLQVAVVIEVDDTLQGRQVRRLGVVADVLTGNGHAVLQQAADGVFDDQYGVIRGQRVILRRLA